MSAWIPLKYEGRGALPKKIWLASGKERALFKPDTKMPDRKESEIEYDAYRIAAALGISHAKTEILKIKSSVMYGMPENLSVQTGTLSYDFKTETGIAYIPIEELYITYSGNITHERHYFSGNPLIQITTKSFSMETIKTHLPAIETDTVDMLFMDCLISNRDRHARNWEVMMDSKKELIGLAPLFDHDKSMWNYYTPQNDICRVPWREGERPLKHYEMFERLAEYYPGQVESLLSKCEGIEFNAFVNKRYETMKSVFYARLRVGIV
jgi:hypothetical protein